MITLLSCAVSLVKRTMSTVTPINVFDAVDNRCYVLLTHTAATRQSLIGVIFSHAYRFSCPLSCLVSFS